MFYFCSTISAATTFDGMQHPSEVYSLKCLSKLFLKEMTDSMLTLCVCVCLSGWDNLKNGWTDFHNFFLFEHYGPWSGHGLHGLLNFFFLILIFVKKRLKNDHFRGFPPVFCHNSESSRSIGSIFGM